VFAKCLLRLKGLSVEMAQAIVTAHPCPALLREAALAAGSQVMNRICIMMKIVFVQTAAVALISDLRYGIEAKRKVPKTIAEAVIKFWTSDSLV
jgi:hypothetical protein